MLKTFLWTTILGLIFYSLEMADSSCSRAMGPTECATKNALQCMDAVKKSITHKFQTPLTTKNPVCLGCKNNVDISCGGYFDMCWVLTAEAETRAKREAWDELMLRCPRLADLSIPFPLEPGKADEQRMQLLKKSRSLDEADKKAQDATLIAEAVATTVEAEKPAHATTQALVRAAAAQLTAAQMAAAQKSEKAHAATHALVKGAAAAAQSRSTVLLATVNAYAEASASRDELLLENILGHSAPASAAGAAAAPHDDEVHFRRMAAESLAKKTESEAKKAALEAEEAQLRVELLKAQLAALKLGTGGGAPAAAGAGAAKK